MNILSAKVRVFSLMFRYLSVLATNMVTKLKYIRNSENLTYVSS